MKILKIKILERVPVELSVRPTIGEIYDVVRFYEPRNLAFVEVNGSEIGVYLGHEAEIVGE